VAKSFNCKLITPEARLVDADATYVSVPAHDGLMGILPNRAPFVAKLGLGELTIRHAEGGDRSFLLDGGFGQMVGDTLRILAEHATPVEKLDLADAEAELAEASARKATDPDEMDRITHERQRARLKVRLAKDARSRGI
jgi:F-type H+-transporting ATPase subunit epsilon